MERFLLVLYTDCINCLDLIKVMDIESELMFAPQQVVMADDSKVIH